MFYLLLGLKMPNDKNDDMAYQYTKVLIFFSISPGADLEG